MGAAPRKTQQRSPKSVQATSLGYSIAKSALKVVLTFSKVEKTKLKNVHFVHLLSSSSSSSSSFQTRIAQKLYGVCECYTYQTTALLPDIFLFWFGAAYKLRLTSYGQETVSPVLDTRVIRLLGLLFNT